jgi:hypothetical protein
MTCRKLVIGIAVCALVTATLGTPPGRVAGLASLAHVVEAAVKVAHIPCWLMDHSGCCSLDRLDSTCPQYM